MAQALNQQLVTYRKLGLMPIPLKPRSKEPLVKWGNDWHPTPEDIGRWFASPRVNVAVRCGENIAALDFDSEASFHEFIATHDLPQNCPLVKTGRGYHIWLRPTKPIRSQVINGVEIKCLGSYIVAPPSLHPSGIRYGFEVAPNGALPEIDLEAFLGLGKENRPTTVTSEGSIPEGSPSDFALCYGKSSWSQAMCGKATVVLTRCDGKPATQGVCPVCGTKMFKISKA